MTTTLQFNHPGGFIASPWKEGNPLSKREFFKGLTRYWRGFKPIKKFWFLEYAPLF
jgi:hypothetical protein